MGAHFDCFDFFVKCVHSFLLVSQFCALMIVQFSSQEYGITKEEKLVISQRICTPLLRKILSDARYTDVDECTRLHAGLVFFPY